MQNTHKMQFVIDTLTCPAMMYQRGISAHSYGIPNTSVKVYVPNIIGNCKITTKVMQMCPKQQVTI